MPLYDMKCIKCGHEFEFLAINTNILFCDCPECQGVSEKIFPKKAPNFKLSYNPKTDVCDWNGNTSRYWDDYKKMKEDGKNPRIPSLDGDG